MSGARSRATSRAEQQQDSEDRCAEERPRFHIASTCLRLSGSLRLSGLPARLLPGAVTRLSRRRDLPRHCHPRQRVRAASIGGIRKAGSRRDPQSDRPEWGSARSTAATPTASSVSLSRRRGRGACLQLMRSIVRRSSPRPGRAPGPSIVRHHGCGATGRALVQARHVPAGRYRRGMIGLPGQRQAVLACRSKLAAGVPRVRPRSVPGLSTAKLRLPGPRTALDRAATSRWAPVRCCRSRDRSWVLPCLRARMAVSSVGPVRAGLGITAAGLVGKLVVSFVAAGAVRPGDAR